jgi:hypothetical protein
MTRAPVSWLVPPSLPLRSGRHALLHSPYQTKAVGCAARRSIFSRVPVGTGRSEGICSRSGFRRTPSRAAAPARTEVPADRGASRAGRRPGHLMPPPAAHARPSRRRRGRWGGSTGGRRGLVPCVPHGSRRAGRKGVRCRGCAGGWSSEGWEPWPLKRSLFVAVAKGGVSTVRRGRIGSALRALPDATSGPLRCPPQPWG